MKKLLLLPVLFFTLFAAAQTTYSVSMNGIGELKLDMKKTDLEKILGHTLKLSGTIKQDYDRDTLAVKYKDIDVKIVLIKQPVDDKKSDLILYEISSSSPLIKTRSNIGMGDDKYKIISTYEGYSISIYPTYEQDYKVKSKTKSTIWLHSDDGGKVMIFNLNNNKVENITVTNYEGD